MFALFAGLTIASDVASSAELNLIPHATCCPLNFNEDSCIAETGADCAWLDISDPAQKAIYDVAGSECVGIAYKTCKLADPEACCGPCPGEAPGPKTVPSPAQPGDPKPEQCSEYNGLPYPTKGAVSSEPPKPVKKAIDDAFDKDCKVKNIKDCFKMDSDGDYSTHDYEFNGVMYVAEPGQKGSCCYKYTSIYNGNTDCTGKQPAQSHWLLDIDCDEKDYRIVSGGCSYGTDASVCYKGLKFDTGCSGECQYEVCIDWLKLGEDECPETKGFIGNKAGTGMSFVAMDGVPSCKGYGYGGNKQLNVVSANNVETLGYDKFVVQAMAAGLVAVVVITLLAVWYCSRTQYQKLPPF